MGRVEGACWFDPLYLPAADLNLQAIRRVQGFVSQLLFLLLFKQYHVIRVRRQELHRPLNSGAGSAGRVGSTNGEPAENLAANRKTAVKTANLLEGLDFPATKEDIKNHINRKPPAMGNRTNDVVEAIWNKLDDKVEYHSAYEIEKAAGLVRESG